MAIFKEQQSLLFMDSSSFSLYTFFFVAGEMWERRVLTSDIVVVEVKRPTSPRASQMDAPKKQHFASEKRVRCYISNIHFPGKEVKVLQWSLMSTSNSVGHVW